MTATCSKDCYCANAPECPCVLCKVCHEAWTSSHDVLCRSCDIDGMLAAWTCCPCGARLYNPRFVDKQPHAETCPHADSGAFDPVDDSVQALDPIADAYARGYRAGQASPT